MKEITYSGHNTRAVRAQVDADPRRPRGETWFFTKGMSASTGGQAWRYVKDPHWQDSVQAALYDPLVGWQPVCKGDTIVIDNGRNRVLAKEGA